MQEMKIGGQASGVVHETAGVTRQLACAHPTLREILICLTTTGRNQNSQRLVLKPLAFITHRRIDASL
jgi:hypothetical protein